MFRERINFAHAFGKLAKIKGSAECSDSGIKFEVAMTDSLHGRVEGVTQANCFLRGSGGCPAQ